MADFTLTRKHSGWDVLVGGGLVVLGLVILGNAVIATRVSIQFLGWLLVIAGVAGLLGGLLSLRSGRFWPAVISGAVFLVAGLVCLRHTHAAAVTLTLVVGSLFLLTGVVRLFAAAAAVESRWALLLGGAVSTLLGLVVLLNLFDASYALLGVLLGIQVLVEGVAIAVVGRVSVSSTVAARPIAPA
jgi:uncharacterized membrane protein HdeD (DUF308 family)